MEQSELETISKIDYQRRLVDGGAFISPRGPYRSFADLWDDDEPVVA